MAWRACEAIWCGCREWKAALRMTLRRRQGGSEASEVLQYEGRASGKRGRVERSQSRTEAQGVGGLPSANQPFTQEVTRSRLYSRTQSHRRYKADSYNCIQGDFRKADMPTFVVTLCEQPAAQSSWLRQKRDQPPRGRWPPLLTTLPSQPQSLSTATHDLSVPSWSG